jgi:hypothetical protein
MRLSVKGLLAAGLIMSVAAGLFASCHNTLPVLMANPQHGIDAASHHPSTHKNKTISLQGLLPLSHLTA